MMIYDLHHSSKAIVRFKVWLVCKYIRFIEKKFRAIKAFISLFCHCAFANKFFETQNSNKTFNVYKNIVIEVEEFNIPDFWKQYVCKYFFQMHNSDRPINVYKTLWLKSRNLAFLQKHYRLRNSRYAKNKDWEGNHQIRPLDWTLQNTICNLDKYHFQFGQIHFPIWTNKFISSDK